MEKYMKIILIALVAGCCIMTFSLRKGYSSGISISSSVKKPSRNCVVNGDFERTKNLFDPEGWEKIGKGGISVVDEKTTHGKVLLLDVPRKVARSTGLMYYTDYFPIEPDKLYMIRFEMKRVSKGIDAKVWVKGYAEINGQRREVYKAGHYCRPATNDWAVFGRVFTPQSKKYEIKWAKIMAYAHGAKAGKVYYDNFVVCPITEEEADEINARGARKWTGWYHETPKTSSRKPLKME